MKDLLLVFAGGGFGSILRYLTGKALTSWQQVFPFATLASNLLSCMIFGAIVITGVERAGLSYSTKLFLLTGLCGGFSTFSAFTFETAELFRNGHPGIAAGNILLNLALSICGLLMGAWLVRLF